MDGAFPFAIRVATTEAATGLVSSALFVKRHLIFIEMSDAIRRRLFVQAAFAGQELKVIIGFCD